MRTAAALAVLCSARLAVAAIPFKHWRHLLGGTTGESATDASMGEARRFAKHVERAATLLPFATKCLPRTMALSWILRFKRIGHVVVFAVRPAPMRGSGDQLHAWVEISNETIIGNLPGPWIETLRLGDSRG